MEVRLAVAEGVGVGMEVGDSKVTVRDVVGLCVGLGVLVAVTLGLTVGLMVSVATGEGVKLAVMVGV